MMMIMMMIMMMTMTTTMVMMKKRRGEKGMRKKVEGVRRGDEDLFSYSPYKAEAASYSEPSVPVYVCASRPVRLSSK